MAPRTKRPDAKATVAAKKAAAKAKRQGGKTRDVHAERAGRQGRRTTLRVPPALGRAVARTASDLGISDNEALVHLAALGARAAERQRAARRVIESRSAAVLGGSAPTASLPSRAELREAILVDREA